MKRAQLEQQTRSWKGSQQSSFRGGSIQNAVKTSKSVGLSSSSCFPQNLPQESTSDQDGLTDIIENAFGNRARSLVGRSSEYLLSINETDDASMVSMDEAFDHASTANSKTSRRNRSSRIKSSNQNSSHSNATPLLFTCNPSKKWRDYLTAGVGVLLIVSLIQNYILHVQHKEERNALTKANEDGQSYMIKSYAYATDGLNTVKPHEVYSSESLSQLLQVVPALQNTANKPLRVAKPADLEPMSERYQYIADPILEAYRQEPQVQPTNKLYYELFSQPSDGVDAHQTAIYLDERITSADLTTGREEPIASVTAIHGSPVADPGDLSGYKDAWDPHESTDSPVFWHVPKSGGSTIKDIMGTCHRMTMASEAGIADGHGEDTTIAVVKIGGDPEKGQDPSPFVNVDSTTIAGLERAKKLGLAQSGLADAIVTTYLYEANGLFDPQHRGRLFAVFRHPVDRAISMFQYLQYANWEPTYTPEFAKMSLEEYSRSGMAENNWLTRTLVNKGDDAELTDSDVNLAMDIVRRKFIVGLLSEKEETMERFEKLFKWKYRVNPEIQEICRNKLLGSGANANTSHKKENPGPGTPAYDLLAKENIYDLQLYDYVRALFAEQAAFVAGIPDGFRLDGATCCKCEVPAC